MYTSLAGVLTLTPLPDAASTKSQPRRSAWATSAGLSTAAMTTYCSASARVSSQAVRVNGERLDGCERSCKK